MIKCNEDTYRPETKVVLMDRWRWLLASFSRRQQVSAAYSLKQLYLKLYNCYYILQYYTTIYVHISNCRSTSDVARENQIKAAVAQKKYKAQTASASAEAESEAAKVKLVS